MRSSFVPGLSPRNKLHIVAGAFGFWLIIGLMIYITEIIAHYFFPAHVLDTVEQRQYLVRWVLWLLLTPLIIFLGIRVNTSTYKLPWFVLAHLLLGTTVLALEFLIEASVIKPLAEKVYNRQVILEELLLPFLFKYFAYIVIYFLIIGIVNLYRYMAQLQRTQRDLLQIQLQNKELEFQVTLSRLQALKMQIHPHFLFNVHHSVLSLIAQGASEQAMQMLTLLSELLRQSLEQQNHEFVPLLEEMKIVDLYLQLQRIRFSDRLEYHSSLGPGTAEFPVPFFIVQPLVENAMIHGVEKRDEATQLNIKAVVSGAILTVTVTNTSSASGLPEKIREGIGISNVKSRLQQYYGTEAGFRLAEDEKGNTIATLTIPALHAP